MRRYFTHGAAGRPIGGRRPRQDGNDPTVIMPTDPALWPSETLTAPHDVPDKARRVQRMFNHIAPRYELVNTMCSGGRDAHWRRAAVRLVEANELDRVLDVACGTGDFARAFVSAGVGAVVGCDFAHDMLTRARKGSDPECLAAVAGWCEGDAQRLPFRSGSFTIAACAFGVRNFSDLDAGLGEMHRVLQPGGRAVILEFSRPQNAIARRLYEAYSHYLMPAVATLLSGDRSGAYRYLPRSVVSFVDGEQMIARMRGAGFVRATATTITLGVVTVYVARRD